MSSQLSQEFVDKYRGTQPDWGFNGLGYVVYKRTYARRIEEENRTEEWWETCRRVVDGAQDIGAGLTDAEAETLYDAIFNLKALPAGRMLWQLGTENIDRFGGDSLCNCWWVEIKDISDFGFIFDELMLGGGVGFSTRRMDIGRLPTIKGKDLVTHEKTNDADFIVPDKREGWVELLNRVMEAYFVTGEPFTYSTTLVRGYGEPIRSFGGTASGPKSLIEGVGRISDVLTSRFGRRLRSTDVLDVVNLIGWMVVAGNVRRSAEIAIGDPDDLAFLRAKRWDLGNIPSHRAMSNNSVELRSMDDVPQEFWDGYNGNGEPYGMFNLHASQKYGRSGEVRIDRSISGVNPCGEIPLAHRESCNLAELMLPNIDSYNEFVTLASLLYKVQKAIARLPFRDAETNRIVKKNMRLGLSVSGVMQAIDKLEWLDPGYRMLRELDAFWSAKHGIPESIRLTTIKPSGTISLLAGVTPGVHPGFSRYHVRRVRMSATDPMVDYCRDHGYDIEPVQNLDGSLDYSTSVISFPCEFPADTKIVEDVDPITQLEYVLKMQTEWADNSVSCTVYYHKDDLHDMQIFLKENWAMMKSVSFLLHQDHGFNQAPLEEITATDFANKMQQLSAISAAHVDTFTEDYDSDCDGGACPVR